MDELAKFVDIVRQLRDPDKGCPWDRKQTLMSLRRYLVEESGEYLDAVENGDPAAIKEELGDLLLQVVLNAQVASDDHLFNLQDVAAAESAKMLRRHPHVFGSKSLHTEEELRASWEAIKQQEKADADARPASAIDGVARSLPALMRAQKTADKAARAGFTWAFADEALAKLREEWGEVEEAAASGNDAALEEELGDLLFMVAVVCRWKKWQAEEVLQKSIAKFSRRFRYVESHVNLQQASREEMNDAWQAAKRLEKNAAESTDAPQTPGA